MKLKLIVAAGVGAALLSISVPLVAHHSFAAEYDQGKRVTVKGKFTHMDWVNPHSWVHIDVVGPDGKVTNWAGETPPPNVLYRNGWRPNMLQKGETIEITGFAAKDGTPHMWASTVSLMDRPPVQGKNGPAPPQLSMAGRPPTEGPDLSK